MAKEAGQEKTSYETKGRRPTKARSAASFEKLLHAAAEVLADVGFERLTSNEICARAGLTPPAFYHYFSNKYEVLEELADRLLRKQNEAFSGWLATYSAEGGRLPSIEALETLFQSVIEISGQEPSGMWTLRALRALPNLAHVRLRWQRTYADQVFVVARQLAPNVNADVLWSRIRILVEFSYIIDELSLEEDRISREMLISQFSLLIRGILEKLLEP